MLYLNHDDKDEMLHEIEMSLYYKLQKLPDMISELISDKVSDAIDEAEQEANFIEKIMKTPFDKLDSLGGIKYASGGSSDIGASKSHRKVIAIEEEVQKRVENVLKKMDESASYYETYKINFNRPSRFNKVKAEQEATGASLSQSQVHAASPSEE